MRQKINAMLTPDQQKKYAEIVAAETGRGSVDLGARVRRSTAGKPREVALRLGLTDGNATEVASGELAEGAEVIVGNVERGATAREGRDRRAPVAVLTAAAAEARTDELARSSPSATWSRSTGWATPRCARSTA